MKMKTQPSKIYEMQQKQYSEANLQLYILDVFNAQIKKEEKSHMNKLTFYLKKPEKEEQKGRRNEDQSRDREQKNNREKTKVVSCRDQQN